MAAAQVRRVLGVLPPQLPPGRHRLITGLPLLGLQLVLIALPAAAVMGVAGRLGARDPTSLLVAGLIGLGGAGFMSFWAYYLGPDFGGWFGAGLTVAAFAVALLTLPGVLARTSGSALALPVGLALAFGTFALALGFAYGGDQHPLATASVRFSHHLPADNAIPLLFAQALARPARPLPALTEAWLSSDRPPLQTGLVLLAWPFQRWRPELQYQVIAVMLQASVLIGIWVFVREARLPRAAAVPALAVPVLSGLVLVNTFYVWPKLLAAAFLLPLAGVLLGRRFRSIRASPVWGGACGLLAGLALLSHEGSSIALLGLAAAMLLLRRVPSPPFLAAGLVGVLVCLLPWLGYQHFLDPPGDRLVKWFVGGDPAVTSRSLWATLTVDYGAAGLGGALANHVQNLWWLWGNPDRVLGSIRATLEAAAGGLSALRGASAVARLYMFVQFLPGLGLMALGPIALIAAALRRGRSAAGPTLATAGLLWLFVACTSVIWAGLFFGPATTAPHQGTYVLELLALTGSACALVAWNRVLGWAVCGLQCAGSLFLYAILTPSPADFRVGRANPYLIALAAVALVCVLLILSRAPSAPE